MTVEQMLLTLLTLEHLTFDKEVAALRSDIIKKLAEHVTPPPRSVSIKGDTGDPDGFERWKKYGAKSA